MSIKLLAEKLVSEGNEVIVLSFDLTENLNTLEKINGVTVIRHRIWMKEALLLTLIPHVFNVLRKRSKEVDIFHLYNVFPLAGAGLYSLMGGKKPIVATLNNYAAFCPISSATCGSEKCTLIDRSKCLKICDKNSFLSILLSISYPLLTALSKRLNGYIALSRCVKKCYIANGFDSERIIVIPNFYQKIKKSRTVKKISDNQTFNILYMGRLSKRERSMRLDKRFF